MATEKIEADVEIKSPAEKVYGVLRSQNHVVPKAASDKIHHVEVHEGDWETHGSIKLWKYTIDGKAEVLKEKVTLDDEKEIVTFAAVEGHCLDLYKTFKAIFDVNPGVVKIVIEYEKHTVDTPAPNNYLQFLVNVINDIDAHLLNPTN
ncbi:MLP-like protein 329 [Tripterygium wilfordii]|uniref:MLP-like protein 329 n=1 Tax=Tripterygium wilfordii TaxID=458696 RepID=UPI0018F85351|nr:MLP-like protein 329 [Tripterygium wilfordii]